MSPREHRDVHGHVDRVGLIQAHPKVPLPAEQQQNEYTDVHESHAGCSHETQQKLINICPVESGWTQGNRHGGRRRLTLVSPGVIQVEEYGDQNIQHIAALQDKKQELLTWDHTGEFG